jgi:hypothetical protein
MTPTIVVLLFLRSLLQDPAAAETRRIPVQLGVSISPDTVTVGQQFITVVRVRAPRGAVVTMPRAADSAFAAQPNATALIGEPAVDTVADSSGITVSAAYRFAAWNTGPQRLGLPDVVVVSGADTGYVALADRVVFVRSVLPADTALHVPKPPRPAIVLGTFDWRPLLIAALVLASALLLWRIWIWYRRRSSRSLDPFSEAEREFDRIEAMGLIGRGEAERHAALMSDVLREYLAARVQGIERSHTSSELLAGAGAIHKAAPGLGELLWRTDLIKFANNQVPADEADRLGAAARAIVRSVETSLVDDETASESKAA